jgi:hypothetical protein
LLKFGKKSLVGTDSHLIYFLFPRGTKTNQTNKIQEKANPDDDQSRKIFSLRPYNPERALSRLVSKAKQGQAQLALGWKTDLQKRLLRDKQFGDKGGNAIKVQTESLVPDLSKITKA